MCKKMNKQFEELKESDKVKYEYWYDGIKKGEEVAVVSDVFETGTRYDVMVEETRHKDGAIWRRNKTIEGDVILEYDKNGRTDMEVIIKGVVNDD